MINENKRLSFYKPVFRFCWGEILMRVPENCEWQVYEDLSKVKTLPEQVGWIKRDFEFIEIEREAKGDFSNPPTVYIRNAQIARDALRENK